jgi:membrane fusion protein, heavy metal efflux system
MYRHIIALFALFALVCVGCGGSDAQQQMAEKEPPSRAVTLWTAKMELFMEFPLLAVNSPGKFIVHLTTLDDFQPVRSGKLRLNFTHSSGQTFTIENDSLLREGIFVPLVELPQAGKYDFVLSYDGERVKESFVVDGFEVFPSADAFPPEAEEVDGGISYLKEQQWKVEFRAEPVSVREVKHSIHTIAEVTPKGNAYAEVSAPAAGIVRAGGSTTTAPIGTRVRAGQRLVVLTPPLEGANSWEEQRLAFEQSKQEFERAERLLKRDAISKRDYEQIRQEYMVRKAGYDALGNETDSTLLEVRSPISGVISAVHVQPGQTVTAGQPLITVVDPDRVWLKVSVFEKDIYTLGTPSGIYLTVPGLDTGIVLDGSDVQTISAGAVLDPQSRTVPILLEVPNRSNLLKIGQTLPSELLNGESQATLAVPETALFDEEAQQIVFVHVSGETFEKRVVKTGNHDRGWIAILDGLHEGDRVVTRGGYLVKLASTTAAIGHPHAH